MTRNPLPGRLLAAVVGVSLTGVAMGVPLRPSGDSSPKNSAEAIVRRAAAANAESADAIAELRSMGPEGLRAFLEINRLQIEAAIRALTEARKSDPSSDVSQAVLGDEREPQRNHVLAALDSVCKQKDCFASKLYWYTDLEKAKTAARAEDKLILSLRLLGRLDEDLSCANSRLFRIALYANEQVSKLLREHFVLHWQSVRPVPKLTIDFGDGRKMERTLTGNSIHYVLDPQGRVIDALPGMYGPRAFRRELARISSAAAELAVSKSQPEHDAALRRYHSTRLNELENAWISDVKRASLPAAPSREIPKPTSAAPVAEKAASAAITKVVMVERPILRGLSADPISLDVIGNDAGWSRIAGMHTQDAVLDQATQNLMSFKDPSLTRGPLQLVKRALIRAIAEDTVRNEYVFRARIHQWLGSGAAAPDAATLTEKIYAELFLTPSWDAWLGLRPSDAYSGIDNDGLIKGRRTSKTGATSQE